MARHRAGIPRPWLRPWNVFVNAWIAVRFTAEGWHHWPGASGVREYLGAKHRHLFHVEARIPVGHDDREVEFHDLLDYARKEFGDGDFGASSCEVLARNLAEKMARQYGRACRVSVFEDGEVGSEVSLPNPSSSEPAGLA